MLTMNKDETCTCCDFDSPVGGLKWYDHRSNTREGDWLCEICASTFVSTVDRSANPHGDILLYKTVAVIGNILRKDIKKRGK